MVPPFAMQCLRSPPLAAPGGHPVPGPGRVNPIEDHRRLLPLTLPLILLLPFLAAWLPVLAMRSGRNASAWSAGAVLAASLALLLSQSAPVLAGETLRAAWQWLPEGGSTCPSGLTAWACLFCLLILGIGLLVILYAAYYLSDDDPLGRFFAYLLLFAGAMLGVVLSENLLLLVVFWELTSLTSFLLIAYWHHRADAREGARMALAVTGGGGLCAAGRRAAAGADRRQLRADRDAAPARSRSAPARCTCPSLVLVLLGAFTKSAQFPFHFWLPHAMAAPTPVSAYLHSATMVKAGVFLLARLYPVLSGTDAWFCSSAARASSPWLFGAYVALLKHDLKGLLAYSTISHLGPDHAAVRAGDAAGGGRGGIPHHQPRHLQGLAVHGGRHHRP